MLTRRLQILVDEPQYRRLAREAQRQGASVATIVRHAIDANLPPEEPERRRQAMNAFLSAELMPVPADPADLRGELDAARDVQ